MLNESKYFKNGVSSQNTTNSANTNTSLKSNGNMMIDTSKNHHHLNLHTFNQYNQPIKSITNLNGKHFSDYNNKDFYTSNSEHSSKSINNNSNINSISATKNAYSSNCNSTSSSTSSTGSVNVKFTGFFKDKIDEREKYLTAKYPNHQMALIKKRLKVEFWIDEQLKILFDISDDNSKEDYDICPDDLVDSLLDMDSDNERKTHVLKQLTKAKKTKDEVLNFVDELLKKLRML